MKPYVNCLFQTFSCAVILLAFLWLAIGSSSVYIQQQKQLSDKSASKENTSKSENAVAPFENATEEITETSPNDFASEYLLEEGEHLFYGNIPIKHNKYPTDGEFINFCGDSVSPPPRLSSC